MGKHKARGTCAYDSHLSSDFLHEDILIRDATDALRRFKILQTLDAPNLLQ